MRAKAFGYEMADGGVLSDEFNCAVIQILLRPRSDSRCYMT